MEQEKQLCKGCFSGPFSFSFFNKSGKKKEKLQAKSDLDSPPESYVGRPVAQPPPSAAGDFKVNIADLGGTEPTPPGTAGVGIPSSWWRKGRLKVLSMIIKFPRGKTVKKEEQPPPQVTADPVNPPADHVQLAVAADPVMSRPPDSDQLAVEASSDVESSFNSERSQYSFRSLDGGNYAELRVGLINPPPLIDGRGGEVKGRFSRKVKYTEAVDELFFRRSDLWTYVAPVASMMMVVVSYHNYGIISNEWKEDLVLFLLGSMASQKLGKMLQYRLPELAVVLVVGADGLLTAPFVIIAFNVLPKDDLLCWKHFMFYVIILVFSGTYCVCLYHIYKEDVREQPTMPTTHIDVSRLSTSFAV